MAEEGIALAETAYQRHALGLAFAVYGAIGMAGSVFAARENIQVPSHHPSDPFGCLELLLPAATQSAETSSGKDQNAGFKAEFPLNASSVHTVTDWRNCKWVVLD